MVIELDLLYKIPMSVPISSSKGWNFDELIEVSLCLARLQDYDFLTS